MAFQLLAETCGESLMAGLQVPELDTDGSDTAEKLEALRTQSVMEEAEAPEVVDLKEIEAIEEVDEEALDCEDPVAPEGFVPRPAAGPSYMDRKLQRLKVPLSALSSYLPAPRITLLLGGFWPGWTAVP